ncbi:MAG: phosphotransferase [Sulfurimonas sp. RIFOXYD12_FULL_33_39]|uniref:phosphotransferase n=1 Tax=unclassified Sulfurimonas TaxID=2623549 RepID=UPI0008BF343E|nr:MULTISPECIES: phosphotransferase [unclassified Sulfurimonas]OHE07594.1 MAG: phosphotransferase [Sulfurimonas sp. RIFCSPLOWO2_12_FULL_34_6]OHE10790.1 MAG: phosphotransferase [Sulfurimonas sp. RIFOXYD12_FULL_33_39]OHE13440.1 MAG: phosphotransferase [Sulfurimonas sp. RIFOXYD2_FULL_34_21]
MGVKTIITLSELSRLFASYEFTELTPTTSGIIDTTYVVSTCKSQYILKRYERAILKKIDEEIKVLSELKSIGLNVPLCIAKSSEWYLYEKIQGTQPKSIKSFHIQALARFLSRFHRHTYKKSCSSNLIEKNEITSLLNYVKSNYFGYYKKLELLKNYAPKNDGLIHGDIFKDNTVFDGQKIGVFDFIDSTCGSFAFDVAVTLVGFESPKHTPYFLNLFLNTYNRHAPKKLNKKDVASELKIASSFYALKRINNYKNTKKAKELLR